MNALIYDTEIVNCIPVGEMDSNLSYCAGWHDHAGMKISCIGVYDFLEDTYRVFLADNMDEFERLAMSRREIIGFNSISFDDKLCAANGITIATTYDLLREVRCATGQPLEFVRGQTRRGYALNDLAWANFGYGKSGDGALAPVLWQQGKIGQVVDYCLRDVSLVKRLLLKRVLTDPHGGPHIELRLPNEMWL